MVTSVNHDSDITTTKGWHAETDGLYSKVEDFIKRIHEKDIELNLQAQTIMITLFKGKDTWGKPIKELHSLAELIGDEMTSYQLANNSESIIDSMFERAEKKSKENTLEATEEFIHALDARSVLRTKKNEIANELFRYIELAYCNNVIDEIGLGQKLKRFEKEVGELREKNANLQKLNDDLAKQIEYIHKHFPDTQNMGEIGDLSSDS